MYTATYNYYLSPPSFRNNKFIDQNSRFVAGFEYQLKSQDTLSDTPKPLNLHKKAQFTKVKMI
jgi:hypothetical protein